MYIYFHNIQPYFIYILLIDHFNLITFTPIYQAHPQWMWNNISTQCKSSIFLVIVYTHDKDIRNGFVRCFWMNIVCYFTDEKWLSFFILSRGHWTVNRKIFVLQNQLCQHHPLHQLHRWEIYHNSHKNISFWLGCFHLFVQFLPFPLKLPKKHFIQLVVRKIVNLLSPKTATSFRGKSVGNSCCRGRQ